MIGEYESSFKVEVTRNPFFFQLCGYSFKKVVSDTVDEKRVEQFYLPFQS